MRSSTSWQWGGLRSLLLSGAVALGLLSWSGSSAAAGSQGYHDSVVVVLDASGSMAGMMPGNITRMVAAKRALKTVLAQVPASTYVGILVLPRLNWAPPLGPKDPAQLHKAIDSIRPGGATPLAEAMKKGADRLLKERDDQFGYGGYRLLVVTDGEHTGGKGLIERFTPDIVQRGITLDVIGVAMPGKHALARYAKSYRSATDPASLEKAIREVFAEVSEKDVGNAAGSAGAEAFELLEGLEPEVAQAMVEALGSTGNHPIGTKPPEVPLQPAPRAEPLAAAPSAAAPSTPKPSAPARKPGPAPAPSGGAPGGCACDQGGRESRSGRIGALLRLALPAR